MRYGPILILGVCVVLAMVSRSANGQYHSLEGFGRSIQSGINQDYDQWEAARKQKQQEAEVAKQKRKLKDEEAQALLWDPNADVRSWTVRDKQIKGKPVKIGPIHLWIELATKPGKGRRSTVSSTHTRCLVRLELSTDDRKFIETQERILTEKKLADEKAMALTCSTDAKMMSWTLPDQQDKMCRGKLLKIGPQHAWIETPEGDVQCLTRVLLPRFQESVIDTQEREILRARNAPPIDMEATVASKLRLAKVMMTTNPENAKKRLTEIVEKYPQTKAAKEAKELLGQLGE